MVLVVVAPLISVRVLVLVELLKVMEPLLVEEVPIVRLVPCIFRLPVSLMAVVPVWDRIELPKAWELENRAIVLAVPPVVVTPLPLPAQFPAVVHRVYVVPPLPLGSW